MTYQQELAELADELQADDTTLTRSEALRQAREQMHALYEHALEWTRAQTAQRSITVTAA